MPKLIDKCILLLCCCIFFINDSLSVIPVFTFTIGILAACLNTYIQRRSFTMVTSTLYLILCLLFPEFCVLLPLIFYDIFEEKLYPLILVGVFAYIRYFITEPGTLSIVLVVYSLLGFLLCYRTCSLQELYTQFKTVRDNSRELNILLENKNKDLLEKQYYEIHVAMLSERNRIAREIHDNVGHLLSRSILQIGAVSAMNKDEALKPHLASVGSTLSGAMDNIRESVHDLHDESMDLHSTVNTMLKDYVGYDKNFIYDMGDTIPRNIKYCFLSIIKEGLSNIVRHSNGNRIEIIMREHPAFYQLALMDNGHPMQTCEQSHGIGLVNIQDRVRSLKGTYHITKEDGYKLYISIPKE